MVYGTGWPASCPVRGCGRGWAAVMCERQVRRGWPAGTASSTISMS